MSDRTALIISCSQEQAAAIHRRAEIERRTISGYVLRILMRWLDFEDKILVAQQGVGRRLTQYRAVHPAGKKTTMLLRCSKEEADRIKAAARRRSTTISWYVLYTLSLAWSAADRILLDFPNK